MVGFDGRGPSHELRAWNSVEPLELLGDVPCQLSHLQVELLGHVRAVGGIQLDWRLFIIEDVERVP